MKYADIILHLKEAYEEDLKRVLRDALVSLKTNGVSSVKTQQILSDFKNRGIDISVTELLNLLQGDPLIKNANEDEVQFTQDITNIDVKDVDSAKLKAQQDAKTVSDMATKAVKKRF